MNTGYSFYRYFLDPLLRSLRTRVFHAVPNGVSLLEVASGTGDMGFRLASKLSRYTGVDRSESMAMGSGERLSRKRDGGHMEFLNRDGARLSGVDSKSYDMAMISLALHEMPAASRLPVLREMMRCARELLLVDYASPLPRSPKGRILHLAEFLAGGDHYRGFLDYQERGGLDALMKEAGLIPLGEDAAIGGGIRIVRAWPLLDFTG